MRAKDMNMAELLAATPDKYREWTDEDIEHWASEVAMETLRTAKAAKSAAMHVIKERLPNCYPAQLAAITEMLSVLNAAYGAVCKIGGDESEAEILGLRAHLDKVNREAADRFVEKHRA